MHAKLSLAVALIGFASLAQTAQAQQSTADAEQRSLSRVEVQADLALWRRAGLDMLSHVDGQDTFTPDYQQRVATYQRWRSGPEYRAELQQLQGRSMAAMAPAATAQR